MKKQVILLLICGLCTLIQSDLVAQGNSAKPKAKKEKAD